MLDFADQYWVRYRTLSHFSWNSMLHVKSQCKLYNIKKSVYTNIAYNNAESK